MSNVLELVNIRKSFGSELVLNNLSLTVPEHTATALIGASGSGKSTLAYLIAGQLIPDFGLIFWKKDFLDVDKPLDRFKKIQLVFQDPSSALTPFYTPFRTIKEVLKLHFEFSEIELVEKTTQALSEVGIFEEVFHREIIHLSGGQKQRLVIARALCVNPELLILDEPTSSCDLLLQAQILTMIKKKQRQTNLSVIMISHDIKLSLKLADKILVLDKGVIDYFGCPLNQIEMANCKKTMQLLNL